MHQRGVNGFRGVKKYVFERGYIVGEMNCFADTSLKRFEGKVYLTDLLGEQKIVDGEIKEIRLMDHKIIIKENK